MSTDCENLLRKFLVLNPAKRASLETIMKDKWMNMGYEEDELKPYVEPMPDLKDQKRIGKTGTVHKSNIFQKEIINHKLFRSLINARSNDIFFLIFNYCKLFKF